MARMTRFRLAALSIGLLTLLQATAPQAETGTPEAAPAAHGPAAPARMALVVGNGDYRARPLPTAANDAGLVAQSLAQAGFEVTARANLDADTVRATIDAFLDEARAAGPDAILFVYLSGYGVQYSGENYVVPIDAPISHAVDVPVQAVPLTDLARRLAAIPARSRVLVADLARHTPFAEVGMPLAPGLALVAPPPGVVTAFNAAPGAEAPDDASPYGAYARALAEMIQAPGLPLGSLFTRVRLRVDELTDGAAVPWASGAFGDATLYPGTASSAPLAGPAPAPGPDGTPSAAYSALIASDTLADDLSFLTLFPLDALTPHVRLMVARRREAMIWSDSVKADNPRAFWTYMRRYPHGPHFPDARRGLVRLRAPLEPPPRFDIVAFDDVVPPPAGEAALLDASSDPKGSVAIPPPPVSLVPPQRNAFADELAPPLLVPAGVLPIPMPVPLPDGAGAVGAAGAIVQPGVPVFGQVVAKASVEPSGATLTMTGKGGLLFKATETFGGTRSIVQTDPAGAMISRTEFAFDRAGLSIVQTGPGGGIVWKLVTRASPGGGRSTIAANGANEILSIAIRNDQGAVTSVKRGPASVRDLNPVYQPAVAAGQHPTLLRPKLPAPEPLKAPLENDAQAAPAPPPPLTLPPLPVAPPAPPSTSHGESSKPATSEKPNAPIATAGPPGATPKPDVATKPVEGQMPKAVAEPGPESAPRPVADAPAPPALTGLSAPVPEPPRRPASLEPDHGGHATAKAGSRPRPRNALAAPRGARSRSSQRHR